MRISTRITLLAAFLIANTIYAAPPPNSWVGSGPFLFDGVRPATTAIAVSSDGQTVYSGTNSGAVQSYDYGYLLNVGITGKGSGKVVSGDSTAIDCTSGICSTVLLHDTVVSLSADTLTPQSTFDGWSGACSGISASCPVAMTNDTTVGAGFGLGAGDLGPVARIESTGTGYASISNAYQAAGANQTILALLGTHPALSKNLNEAKTITLNGGYAEDQSYTFTTQSGYSTIGGPLRIGAGKLIVNRVKVK